MAGIGAAVIGGFATHAEAQGRFAGNLVNGIEVVADAPGRAGTVPVVSNTTFLSGANICATLAGPRVRPALNNALKQMIVAQIAPQLPGGFGVHSQTNHRLGSACTARSEVRTAAGGNIRINVKIARNRFFLRVTTPSGFPGSIDPNFVVTYDSELNVVIGVPTTPSGSLILGPAVASATNVQIVRANITGKLALVYSKLSKFFGGPDFAAEIRKNRVFNFRQIAFDLSRLNGRLHARARARGYRLEQSYNPQRSTLVLHLTRRAPDPGPIVR